MAIDAVMAISKAILLVVSFGTSAAGASQAVTASFNAAKSIGK